MSKEKEWYKNEIIGMVSRMKSFEYIESIYWFVKTISKKKGGVSNG